MKRVFKYINPIILTVMLLLVSYPRVVTDSTSARSISVEDFGAVGNGTTDDTKAFEDAIAKAGSSVNRNVIVPKGTYRLTRSIQLSGVNLLGVYCAAWPADADKMPTILVDQKEKPALQIQNSTVTGLKISYRHANKSSFTQYKDAIRITGNNGVVKNVKIDNATSGIKTIGSDIQGTYIENVFMPSVHVLGLFLNDNIGLTVVRNVEMWTPTQIQGSPFPQSGVGVKLMNNENVLLEDVFVFNASKGFAFEADSGKGTRATMNNCSADMTAIGIHVKDEHVLEITGGTYWTHTSGILVDPGRSIVDVTGVELRANGFAALNLNGGMTFRISGSIIGRVMDDRDEPAVFVSSNTGVASIVGNIIYCNLKSTALKGAVVVHTPESLLFSSNVINVQNQKAFYPELPENTILSNNVIGGYSK
jgi:hypothetical protein